MLLNKHVNTKFLFFIPLLWCKRAQLPIVES